MLGIHAGGRFVPKSYDIFCGMDVDKRSISATFTDHGEMVKSIRMPYSVTHLMSYVRRQFPGRKVVYAYEAGPTGFGLYDQLSSEGQPCMVVAPSMIPTVAGQRVKTNRIDSQKISQSLRGGQLKSIHVPSSTYRQLRHLVQLRDTYVRQGAAFKNRIKSLLLLEGLPEPEGQWSLKTIAQLEALSCSDTVRFKLDHLLSSVAFARRQMVDVQKRIRIVCQSNLELSRNIQYLTSIPGIGSIVASHLLSRIGDWSQMRNVRQIASFLGLVPTERSTGETVRRGNITGAGDTRLQSKLIQAAWVSIRHDPELREFYRRIYHRQPPQAAAKKAIVAVARKLTARIYSVLKEQRRYVVKPTIQSISLTQEELDRPRERLETSPEEV